MDGISEGVGKDQGKGITLAKVDGRSAYDVLANFFGVTDWYSDKTLNVLLAEVLVESGAGNTGKGVSFNYVDRGGLKVSGFDDEGVDKGDAGLEMFEVSDAVADDVVFTGDKTAEAGPKR